MKNKQIITAIAITIAGTLLLGASFFTPPMGIIHPSVLAAFGEILTFAGALMGLDYKYKHPQK
ncbi:MAG: hypothetical protein J6U94_01720 [Paludibacteraceae bacterium]|nr:hypothetical protein [Paludibacteraceae bacterium]